MSEIPQFAANWIAQWKRASVNLEQVRKNELANLTEEKARRQTLSLLDMGSKVAIPEARLKTSGLIEQQRIFKNYR